MLALLGVLAVGCSISDPPATPPVIRERRILVVDAQNHPIAGAVVEGVSDGSWGTPPPAGARVEWQAVSDDQGIATFPIADGDTTSFMARKTGYALGWANGIEWDESSNQTTNIHRIELAPPASVRGMVRDAEGRNVGDAEVWVTLARMKDKEAVTDSFLFLNPLLARKHLTVQTGPDGSFTIEGLPQGTGFDLAARKPRWVTASRGPGAAPAPHRVGQGEIHLTLVRPATIEGRVLEEPRGTPISGVRVVPLGGSAPDPLRGLPVTGPDGGFRLSDLSPGRLRLAAVAGTNSPPDWIVEPVELDLEPGATNRDVKIVANRGSNLLKVSVRTQPGNLPLEDVGIVCYGQRHGGETRTTRGGAGVCRLMPGQYVVEASKPGWILERGKVACELGATERLTLRATLAPRVAGIVQDTANQPASNVWVNLFPLPRSPEKTDREGRFAVALDGPRIPSDPGEQRFVIARDESHDLAASLELPPGDSSTHLIVPLQPALSVAGRVASERGGGIRNALVRLRFERRGNTADLGISRVTDGEGRFEFSGLPSGWRFQIEAAARGHGNLTRALDPPEAGTRRIELEPFDLPAAVRQVAGVVLGESGGPARGLQVSLSGAGQPQTTAFSDENGKFLFEAVCPGALRLSAYGQGGIGSVNTVGGDTNVVLRLGEQLQANGSRPVARPQLTGIVLGANGKPAAGVRLHLIPSFGPETRFTTDRHGRFRTALRVDYSRTRSARYTLIALDPSRKSAASTELDEGSRTVTLRLEPAWTWRGRAIDATGAGISNLSVRLLVRGAQAARGIDLAARVTSDGRFEIEGLPAGRRVRLNLSAPGYGSGGCETDAPKPGQHAVETEPVTLARADLALGGIVLDAKGRPLEGATVIAQGEEQPSASRQSDSEGRFSFKNICAGPVQLSVSSPDRQSTALSAQAGETNLVVRFPDPNVDASGAPMPKIAGVVTLPDGAPARGVRTILLPVNQYGQRTDDRGRFELSLPPTAFRPRHPRGRSLRARSSPGIGRLGGRRRGSDERRSEARTGPAPWRGGSPILAARISPAPRCICFTEPTVS